MERFRGHGARRAEFAWSAAEELYEESMGVFGRPEEIEPRLRREAREFRIPSNSAHVFLWRVPYDPGLVLSWNRIWAYISRCAPPGGKVSFSGCPEGFFEKKQIAWFSENELRAAIKSPSQRFRTPFLRSLAFILGQGAPSAR